MGEEGKDRFSWLATIQLWDGVDLKLLKINFSCNLAGKFSLVCGKLRVRTASFRIFTLFLRCVEPFARCFITLPAFNTIDISSSVTRSPFKWIQKALLIWETLAI